MGKVLPFTRTSQPVYNDFTSSQSIRIAKNYLAKKLVQANPALNRRHAESAAHIFLDRIMLKSHALIDQPLPTLTYYALSNIPVPLLIDDESAARFTKQLFPSFKPPISMSEGHQVALKKLVVAEWDMAMREHPEMAQHLARTSIRQVPLSTSRGSLRRIPIASTYPSLIGRAYRSTPTTGFTKLVEIERAIAARHIAARQRVVPVQAPRRLPGRVVVPPEVFAKARARQAARGSVARRPVLRVA